jgi:hypothetical protein
VGNLLDSSQLDLFLGCCCQYCVKEDYRMFNNLSAVGSKFDIYCNWHCVPAHTAECRQRVSKRSLWEILDIDPSIYRVPWVRNSHAVIMIRSASVQTTGEIADAGMIILQALSGFLAWMLWSQAHHMLLLSNFQGWAWMAFAWWWTTIGKYKNLMWVCQWFPLASCWCLI